jgi:hypothetical protein
VEWSPSLLKRAVLFLNRNLPILLFGSGVDAGNIQDARIDEFDQIRVEIIHAREAILAEKGTPFFRFYR